MNNDGSSLDHAAVAVAVALRDVAKDRERGLPVKSTEMLRRVAGAVLTVHEAYGGRRCESCEHWHRVGESPWGACELVESEGDDGLPYLAGEEGVLVTPEKHGCLAWQEREQGKEAA